MAHLSLEEGKKIAVNGFLLLLAVTVVEVLIALLGNGHLVEGLHFPKLIMVPVMVVLSLYKAYFIVKEFMHLGHETKGMAASIVLPTLLLIWAIIAFLWEGDAWGGNRDYVRDKNQERTEQGVQPENAPKGELRWEEVQSQG